MVSIKDRKILRQMFSHYDYVMTTAQLSKEKLYYRDIQRMLGAGLIEKVKRGYYHWTMGSGKGDVVIISRLCESIESMEQSKEFNRSVVVMPNMAIPLW